MVKPQKTQPGRSFWAALIVLLVGGAGALAYLANRTKEVVIQMDPTLPKVAAEGYSIGKPDAPVQIIEFADYECPVCAQYAAVTEPDIRKRLVEPGLVRYTYYDFPLDIHRNTWAAAMTAACANDQGKFWEMHDRVYAGQLEWNGQATDSPKSIFKGYAQELGLDVAAWESCYDSKKHLARIQASRAEAEKRRLNGTPAFIVGDKLIPGNASYDQIKALVDSAMAKTTPAATPASN